MIDRTIISLLAGLLAAFVVLIAAWLVVSAYSVIGWQIPLAAGVAVFVSLWTVDLITDELAKRRK